jgi:multidrug efflux system membrane fusion protein
MRMSEKWWTVDGGRLTVGGSRLTVAGGRVDVSHYGSRLTVDGGQRVALQEGASMQEASGHWQHATSHRLPSTVHRPPSTIIAFALASLATLACSGAKQKPTDEKVPVTVAMAQAKDVPVQIRAIGNVQPLSTVAVRALAGGQLIAISFKEGDEVHKGQLLFTIDRRPYEAALAQAQASLARDEANLHNAEAEATRYADLIKKDYVTHEDYDRFVSAATAARAVSAADRAAIQNAQLELSYCEIRSPMDGRTGALMAHVGNIIKANDTAALVVINQVRPVSVQFSVPEAQLGSLRSRMDAGNVPVEVSPQAGGAPIAKGRLSFVDNAVDSTTGTITLKGQFDNRDSALWPGQYVNVAVTLSTRPNAVVIPSQAVQTSQKGQYVYVVKEGDAVEMRPITVFQTLDQQTIIEKGVSAGETVVTDGQLRLTPKSHVEVK